MGRHTAVLAGLALGLATAAPAMAESFVFSYDAATPETQRVAGRGLTFLFDRSLFGGAKLRRLYATTDPAGAALKPASDGELGAARGRLRELGGGDVYRIVADKDGAPLIRALCRGATRGWLAVSPVKSGAPLRLNAFGAADDGQPAHCLTLDYQYRGEWRMPDGRGVRLREDQDNPVYPE